MRRRWLLLPLGLVVIGGAAAYEWWQSPSSTTSVTTTASSTSVLGSETTLQAWQTGYFTTRYPSTLRILTTSENSSKAIMGSYLLSSSDPTYSDQVGVTVGRLGNTTFDEISALKYRDQHPELFTRSSRDYAPSGTVVFDGTGDYEADFIWQNGDRYAVVAVTGSNGRRAELEQIARSVVANWQWR